MPTRLRSLRVTKIALCPKGKNPDAQIVMFKEECPEVLAEDFAGPSRTYPVTTPDDVAAAARALDADASVSKSATMRRLISIAVRKGASFVAQIPGTWAVQKILFDDIQADVERGKLKSAAWASISDYLDTLRWALSSSVWDQETPQTREAQKSIAQFAQAIGTAFDTMSKEDTSVKKYIDLSKEELVAELEARDKPAPPPTGSTTTPVTKEVLDALPEEVRKAFEAQNEQIAKAQTDAKSAQEAAAKAEESARVEKERRETLEAVEKAKKDFPNLPGTDAEKATLVKAVLHLPKNEAELVEKALKAGDAALATINKEIGHDDPVMTGAAIEKLNTLAKTLIEKDPTLTFAKAFDTVCLSNPALFAEHRQETKRAAR